jgi:hypothetical protein
MSSIVLAVLWGVVLWRLPAAWQTSWKRAPWVALAALAVALTLDLPAVTTGIDRLAGVTLIAVMLKHLAVIASCTALLSWVGALARQSATRGFPTRYIVALAVTGTLVTLFLVMPRHETTRFTETATGLPAIAYLWVFYGYLGAALGVAAVMFWRARREITRPGRPRRGLRTGLLLLAAGSAVVTAYSACQMVALVFRPAHQLAPATAGHWQDAATAIENLAIILILAGTALPAFAAGWQSVRELADLRALRPLWRDLTAATPEVAAGPITGSGRAPRLRSPHMRLIRRVAEIRDSSLQLSDNVPGAVTSTARTILAGHGLEGSALDAAAEACWLRLAAQAAADQAEPPAGPSHILPGGASLDEETRWLRQVAAAYGTPAVRETAAQLSAADRGPAPPIPPPRDAGAGQTAPQEAS